MANMDWFSKTPPPTSTLGTEHQAGSPNEETAATENMSDTDPDNEPDDEPFVKPASSDDTNSSGSDGLAA